MQIIPNRNIIKVSELNRKIKNSIDSTFPEPIWVLGEIRDLKRHSNRNWYFTLRDEDAQVNCIMWNSDNRNMDWNPEDGVIVEALCKPALYIKGGKYELFVKQMHKSGVGDRAIQFERLKKKLFAEGLFDTVYKKKLPTFPMTIGVVTSRTGAAIRDIMQVIQRRAPWANIILRDTLVQGDLAPKEIIRAIQDFNFYGKADLLIVGRGGGSEDDLWCFNDELVARAIYDSEIPIISAVGHEIDFTIADFVADVRAPTPSAAAEIAVMDISEIFKYLEQTIVRIYNSIQQLILRKKNALMSFKHSLDMNNPSRKVEQYKRYIDEIGNRSLLAVRSKLDRGANRLELLKEKLKLLSIDKVLERGFSLVTFNGEIIKECAQLNIGDNVKIKFFKGKIKADVTDIEI